MKWGVWDIVNVLNVENVYQNDQTKFWRTSRGKKNYLNFKS